MMVVVVAREAKLKRNACILFINVILGAVSILDDVAYQFYYKLKPEILPRCYLIKKKNRY
jgi:hypothetical protein